MDAYAEYLIGEGLSAQTVRNYVAKLRRAIEWAEGTGADLDALAPSEAQQLADLWPKRNSSRRQLRSALRHYWNWKGIQGPDKAIRVPPPPTPKWRGLEDEQVKDLLRAASVDWPRGGVIYLGLYLGLRRAEIATLRWGDFDHAMEWVTIVGKGDRTRHLPIHPKLRAFLLPQKWPGEYVFPGRLGGHVTLTTINNWVEHMGRQAGIGHLHPHQLRHTSGGKINDETGDIYAAQHWLGHVQVETTMVYTRLKDARMIAAMRELDWEDVA